MSHVNVALLPSSSSSASAAGAGAGGAGAGAEQETSEADTGNWVFSYDGWLAYGIDSKGSPSGRAEHLLRGCATEQTNRRRGASEYVVRDDGRAMADGRIGGRDRGMRELDDGKGARDRRMRELDDGKGARDRRMRELDDGKGARDRGIGDRDHKIKERYRGEREMAERDKYPEQRSRVTSDREDKRLADGRRRTSLRPESADQTQDRRKRSVTWDVTGSRKDVAQRSSTASSAASSSARGSEQAYDDVDSPTVRSFRRSKADYDNEVTIIPGNGIVKIRAKRIHPALVGQFNSR